MIILEYIGNSTPYRLFADGSLESALSNRGSGIAEPIFKIVILNLKKSILGQKKKI